MFALQVSGMTCGGCARRVTTAVQSVDREAKVAIDLPGKRITVDGVADPRDVAAAVSRAGYPATLAAGAP